MEHPGAESVRNSFVVQGNRTVHRWWEGNRIEYCSDLLYRKQATLDARQGGDLWQKVSGVYFAVAAYLSFTARGVQAQPHKQLFSGDVGASSVQAMREFLRVFAFCHDRLWEQGSLICVPTWIQHPAQQSPV